MRETLFSLTPTNSANCQALYRGPAGNEYYEGDYWLDDAPFVSVTCERIAMGPLSVASICALNRQYFRRNRRHIRSDNLDLCVLWFVKKGLVTFSNHQGTQQLGPQGFLLTRSTYPFYIECEPEQSDSCDIVTVIVPALIARNAIAFEGHPALFLTSPGPEIAMAEMLIQNVLENGECIAEEASRHLLDTALTLVGQAVRDEPRFAPVSRSPIDRRYQDVLKFMEENLVDPALSPRMAARGCDISLRHLSNILGSRHRGFSRLMWDMRMQRALDLLKSTDPQKVSIAEISYGLGFKSPAHFSRMFKRKFARNPRDVRKGCADTAKAPGLPELAER